MPSTLEKGLGKWVEQTEEVWTVDKYPFLTVNIT